MTVSSPTRRPATVPRPVACRGRELIGRPLLNKGTAFTREERDALGLHGLLPARVTTIDEQVALELEHVRRKGDDLERYIGLAALQDRNETLFYRVLVEHLEEFLPIVYTPTVGRACQEFSHIFRRPRGVWITPTDVRRIDGILRGAAEGDVRLIVVTDNERILGLGDQGVGGMPIPVGKLALYTAAAGVHPSQTLPISLDVGTDNQALLDDPLYLGYRAPRLRGAAYDEVVEAFAAAVGRVFPSAVIQWEDFKQHIAVRMLERYRRRVPSFNDDIQGTGAVALAGVLAARSGDLGRDRFLVLGAGAAGLGIATLIRAELGAADAGAPRIVLMDSRGVVHSRRPELRDGQRPFAIDPGWLLSHGLEASGLHDPVAVARVFRPTVLIGTTGVAGVFSEPLVRQVAGNSVAPIVMPLSNPSDRAEAQPADVIRWSGGRALVATGSPFPPVELEGGGSLIVGQANNVFVFPGVGLAAIVAEAREIPDSAFLVAARRLAGLVRPDRVAAGALYPPIGSLRSVTREVAIAVVRHLGEIGQGRRFRDDEIEDAIDDAMWWPGYVPYVAA